MKEPNVVARFAPSPTGDLHLGGAFVALASWWLARTHGGRFVVRMEDIDTPRVVAGSAARILEDLRWLGLEWDGDVVFQSQRTDLYVEAIAQLGRRGLVYPCDCSRAELARVASAPHAGEELVYPGFCAELDSRREMKRDPALRVRVPRGSAAIVDFEDEILGKYTQNLETSVGDFVVRRGDGIFSYQLVVVVDDTEQGITDVVRGADLLASTPRQIFLARALERTPPRYYHVPLVLGSNGERLAKRTPGAVVRGLKERGVSREEILGELAAALGILAAPRPVTTDELASAPRAEPWPTSSWRIPSRWI